LVLLHVSSMCTVLLPIFWKINWNILYSYLESGYYQSFYVPTDVQEFCFKRNIKIYIKNAPTCFGLITIIRERAIWALLKLLLLKNQLELSVKIHRCGQFGGVAAYIIRSCLMYVCDTIWNIWIIPNSVTNIHQQGPDNICGHTTEMTTTMYFNW
jgi:hypothetical protein